MAGKHLAPGRRWQVDAAWRTVWTVIEALLGLVVIEAWNLPVGWASVVATVIAAVKSYAVMAVSDPAASRTRAVLERAAWTLAQTAIAFLTVDMLPVPLGYAPLVAMLLAAVKAVLARGYGSPATAATLPAALDPGLSIG